MKKLDQLIELYPDHTFVHLDDLDDALVSVIESGNNLHLVYSYDLLIETLMLNNDFSFEEAEEWYDYNVLPLLSRIEDEEKDTAGWPLVQLFP